MEIKEIKWNYYGTIKNKPRSYTYPFKVGVYKICGRLRENEEKHLFIGSSKNLAFILDIHLNARSLHEYKLRSIYFSNVDESELEMTEQKLVELNKPLFNL